LGYLKVNKGYFIRIKRDKTSKKEKKELHWFIDTGSLTVDGLERTYVVHVPLSYHGAYPVPLVLVFHGGGGSAERMVELTGFNTLSDEKGFIVVYPNGVENHWNDGRLLQKYRAHRENIDDVAFVSALIDHLTEEYHIDELRIYAAGISNGAMMCCRLACELSERLAGIAMVAGAMPEELSSRCSPSTPVSVVLINGTEDPLVLWEGGEITIGRQRLGKTVSVSDTVQFWVIHNTCSPPVGTWLPDIHDDNTTVYKEVYGAGRGGTEVILYAVEGGGHTWPGGPQYITELIVSRTCYDIHATEVIWQFFAEHARE
jgi:polyhydroxybutyrate depolymerase